MSEQTSNRGGTLATVLATAAVTVAVGITAASMGGYLMPPQEASTAETAAPAIANESLPAPSPSATNGVVLVPVAPDGPAVDPAAAPPDSVFADDAPQLDYERAGRRSERHSEWDEEDDHEEDD